MNSEPKFYGPDLRPEDIPHLKGQTWLVYEALKDAGRGWLSLRNLSQITGASEPSVSARLRTLRSMGFNIERVRPHGRRYFFYRMNGYTTPVRRESKDKMIAERDALIVTLGEFVSEQGLEWLLGLQLNGEHGQLLKQIINKKGSTSK